MPEIVTHVSMDGLDESQKMLARFNWASAATQAADRMSPVIAAALTKRVPYKDGPGRHMRDTLRFNRETTTSELRLTFGYTAPWASYVLHGTRAHTITPKAARALHWVEDGGQSRFAMVAHIPAIPANRFPEKAWEDVKEAVQVEFRNAMEVAFRE